MESAEALDRLDSLRIEACESDDCDLVPEGDRGGGRRGRLLLFISSSPWAWPGVAHVHRHVEYYRKGLVNIILVAHLVVAPRKAMSVEDVNAEGTNVGEVWRRRIYALAVVISVGLNPIPRPTALRSTAKFRSRHLGTEHELIQGTL